MTGRPLVVFPDADPDLLDLLHDAAATLNSAADLRVFAGRPASVEEYCRRIDGANALLLGWELPTEVINASPELEAISFLGHGVSNFLDLQACAQAGITVMTVPRYGDAAVAEHTLALILASIRGVVQYDALVRAGDWRVTGLARELATTTLGIVGLGGVGTRVAKMASRLGMPVIAWTRSGRPGEVRDGTRLTRLDTVISQSDVVSLHLPLAPDTVGILSADRLATMRPGAILVNTARAELVEEEALIAALRHGPLALAAFDVFWQEPPAADHPLLQMRNVILTPHVAFATADASKRMVRTAVDNLVGYFAGEPRHVVLASTSNARAVGR